MGNKSHKVYLIPSSLHPRGGMDQKLSIWPSGEEKMNIILIGMRGSGKTTVGKILAKKLGKKFIEIDKLVVKKAKITIPQIVKKFSWEKFRDLEEEITKELALSKNVVIATGGGVVIRENNMNQLKKGGKLIWLKADVNTLTKRIGNDSNRPSLTSAKSRKADMRIVLAKRGKLYQKAADFIIKTENKSPQEVVEEIIKFMTR